MTGIFYRNFLLPFRAVAAMCNIQIYLSISYLIIYLDRYMEVRGQHFVSLLFAPCLK